MSRGVNKAIILGNVGREPDIRYTQSGSAVANFSVAVNEKRKVNGEWQDHVEWINCVAWGKLAETCSNYLTKGKQVYIEGRIQTRKWEKDGVTRYQTEIVVDQLVLLGGQGEKQNKPQGQQQQCDNADNLGGYDSNDDFPF